MIATLLTKAAIEEPGSGVCGFVLWRITTGSLVCRVGMLGSIGPDEVNPGALPDQMQMICIGTKPVFKKLPALFLIHRRLYA
jgi:hypothetical protein